MLDAVASKVRVRMAPSPTGLFHIGSARTTLFNYLFARRHGGQFVLRIEDTDMERSEERFEQDILGSIDWLGLDYDEGPGKGGAFGPYRQSERAELYPKYVDQLLSTGHAYHCYCSKEELAAEREAQRAAKQPPKYSGRCRQLTAEQKAEFEREGRTPVVRFQMPERELVYDDLIKGEIKVDMGLFSDLVIQKADGNLTYNMANVIDDHLMQISHVIRGEDHISNTPKQILIYEAMGWPTPAFGHIPLILNEDRSKMSKRSGPTAVAEYRELGYLSEAVVNFLALLGWSPGDDRELFNLTELESAFDLSQVQTSPAVFNVEKLNWFNGQYIRDLAQPDLMARVLPFLRRDLESAPDDLESRMQEILPLVYERLVKLSEISELVDFFFADTVELDPELLLPKQHTAEASAALLEELAEQLSELSPWEIAPIEQLLRAKVESSGWKVGHLFMLVRIAVTGRKATPPLFETMAVLGQGVTCARLRAAAASLVR